MRAALYARVSTEEQLSGYSIDAQLRACRSFAKERGWEVKGEYVDEGKSARRDDINKRPQFKAMVEHALVGGADTIVVHKLDRFSRNLRITLDCFERLSKAGVAFVSISENMDFSTPWGRLALTLLGGLAQFYSDNLGLEVKKGKAERKAQGLYNGLLPFGMMKGEDGIPVADPENLQGLILAFELGSQGKSDRDVARALNAAGYRTAGNQGNRPFTKDTVRDVLQNKFYLGMLPEGQTGWVKGKHEPVISEELFNSAVQARERNRVNPRTITETAKAYSLSGMIRCDYCGSRLRVQQNKQERVRLYCSGRAQGGDCTCKGTFLEVYERQIEWYLRTFVIPKDYQQRILELHLKLKNNYHDVGKARTSLENRLERIKSLYTWGDITEEQYRTERDGILRELSALTPVDRSGEQLERLASFLANIALAWHEADQEQRNRLARVLFVEMRARDNEIVAVKPHPEFEPFFRLNHEVCINEQAHPDDQVSLSHEPIAGDPEGDSSRMQYVPSAWFPVRAPKEVIAPPRVGKAPSLTPEEQAHVARDYGKFGLRQMARRYGVSYETVRRAILRHNTT